MSCLKKFETIVIKNPNPLPPHGIICAHPGRVQLIAENLLQNVQIHTEYRGFIIYTGLYNGVPVFIANTGIGAPAAAFLVEELCSYGVKTIVRLGSNDSEVNEDGDVFILRTSRGLVWPDARLRVS